MGAHSRVSAYAASGVLVFIVVVAVSALAVWMISPRLTIDAPSFVDDWSAISSSPDQLSRLVRLENPEPERFRPSWIAWNDLQWHTFDTPRGLVGPTRGASSGSRVRHRDDADDCSDAASGAWVA